MAGNAGRQRGGSPQPEIVAALAATNVAAALRSVAPNGIDVYFDNVGGPHLAAAVECTRPFARVILCGVIGNDENSPVHPNLGLAIPNHILFQGISTRYYLHEMPAFQAEMMGWIKAGHVRWRETAKQGIEAAPTALFELLAGRNIGKMVVKLA